MLARCWPSNSVPTRSACVRRVSLPTWMPAKSASSLAASRNVVAAPSAACQRASVPNPSLSADTAPSPAPGPAGSSRAHTSNSDATTASVGSDPAGPAPDAHVATAPSAAVGSLGSAPQSGARCPPVPWLPLAARLRVAAAPPPAPAGLGRTASVAARSRPGRSSVFTVGLPLTRCCSNNGGSLLVIRLPYPASPANR